MRTKTSLYGISSHTQEHCYPSCACYDDSLRLPLSTARCFIWSFSFFFGTRVVFFGFDPRWRRVGHPDCQATQQRGKGGMKKEKKKKKKKGGGGGGGGCLLLLSARLLVGRDGVNGELLVKILYTPSTQPPTHVEHGGWGR